MRKVLAGLLWDIGLPLVVYYAGRILGYDVLPALAAAAGAALVRVACIAVVRRRLNGLAAFVGGTFALLLVVSLLTGDPRILLAKESVLSGAAGLLLLGSCLLGRPLVYTIARKANAAKPQLLAEWDDRWHTQPTFRQHFTTLTTVFGGVLLADAIIRLILVYTLPVNTMANLSPAMHVAALALLITWSLWYRNHRHRRMAALKR
ncbi:VC0807 family protein [Kribbella sp. NPDC000426]|uniref:VC0807 family protein n=1 Tax=Kribbella sp. NPDC000426 TaxID=3154255 RepID=UPI0033344F0D